MQQHTLAMNATIWFEVITGVVLAAMGIAVAARGMMENRGIQAIR